jgi:hypothetical protein
MVLYKELISVAIIGFVPTRMMSGYHIYSSYRVQIIWCYTLLPQQNHCSSQNTVNVDIAVLDTSSNIRHSDEPIHSSLAVYLTFHAVAQLVEALRYKQEGRGFNSRWSRNFSLTQSFWPHHGPGVNSASNKNEYQEYLDRKSTRLNSSHLYQSRMPSSA